MKKILIFLCMAAMLMTGILLSPSVSTSGEEASQRTVFDITDYGAVGDGVTDCTAAIQQALDDAGKVQGAVVVPSGKYLTGPLKMPAYTTLRGDAAWSFSYDGGSILIYNGAESDVPGFLDITGAYGCAIMGLCFNGANKGEAMNGIYLCWDKYNGGVEEDTPRIETCRVSEFTGNGIHLEKVWCFSLRHSMTTNNKGAGLYIDGFDGFILDNMFSGNQNHGILGGPTASSLTITGNRIEWNKLGGMWIPYGDSINFTGNFVDRAYGPAVQLGGPLCYARDVTITGNVFRRCGCLVEVEYDTEYDSCSLFLENTNNVVVTGNTFRYGVFDTGYGPEEPLYDIYLSYSTAVIIQSNVMYHGAKKESIVYDGRGDCIIKDNISHFDE
ncbi:MAG: hypothetical protein E7610_08445 [Ruminococcaceae bacterium]|nr:hypothetical protein [Oscillospiraceae bacterium]